MTPTATGSFQRVARLRRMERRTAVLIASKNQNEVRAMPRKFNSR
jgi:hypothetical protein